MTEPLLIERLMYFAAGLGVSFIIGVVHGFLLVKRPLASLGLTIGLNLYTVGNIIYKGWTEYVSIWFKPASPYIIISAIIGAISGEILGIKIGERRRYGS